MSLTKTGCGMRALGLVAALLPGLTAPAGAQDKPAPATCTKAAGVLMAQTSTGWQSITPGKPIPADTPVVSLFDSTLVSANGAVEVRLLADPAHRSHLPILESAVTVHADAGHDLAMTPRRGLIVLTNLKKQGSVTVRLTSRDDFIEVALKEPGAKLALEVYSRHVPGGPLNDPKADEPVLHLFCIALKGEAFLQGKERGVTLHAPPGPAVLIWDSLLREPEVKRLEELPPEITVAKEKDEKLLAAYCTWARKLADESPETVRKEGANSALEIERLAAVTAMEALDDLPGLLGVLSNSRHIDARQRAVLVLRNWLGRAPGQTAKLDAGLRKAGYTEVQSQNVLQLLYGFTPAQRGEPSTYELLLDDLKGSHPALRVLAHWHLVRLAPAGKSIAYDALAPEADRQVGYEQWRKLIPPGKLPPAKAP